MGIFESLVIGIIVFIGGTYFGVTEAKRNTKKVEIRSEMPSERPFREHRKNMLQCKIICGDGRVLSYEVLTGGCKCLGLKH